MVISLCAPAKGLYENSDEKIRNLVQDDLKFLDFLTLKRLYTLKNRKILLVHDNEDIYWSVIFSVLEVILPLPSPVYARPICFGVGLLLNSCLLTGNVFLSNLLKGSHQSNLVPDKPTEQKSVRIFPRCVAILSKRT